MGTEITRDKRILVCAGPGGVGKTTTAAALGLGQALAGSRVLVMTIDPARRLANALGLAELGHDIREIDPSLLREIGGGAVGGSLFAMMLDQKQAFDDLVRRHAKNPASIERIMANPIYAQISSTLAGAQEYSAMTTVQEIDSRGEFDVIVVDTPPTSHALDFLEAPRKLTEAIESPAIEWFSRLAGRSSSGAGSEYRSVIGRTGSYMMMRLSKFVGSQFLEDIGVFLGEFREVLAGIRQQARVAYDLLRQPEVGFVLVTVPDEVSCDEALHFYDRLEESRMPVAGFVVNRAVATHDFDEAAAQQRVQRWTDENHCGSAAEVQAILRAHHDVRTLARHHASVLASLRQRAARTPVVEVPLFSEDVHSIHRLAAVASYLGVAV